MADIGWTDKQNEAMVATYLEYLRYDLEGHRRRSGEFLRVASERTGRSEGGCSMKASNISFLVSELDIPPLSGFKPLPHIQPKLREVVAAGVENSGIREVALRAAESKPEPVAAEPSGKQVEPPTGIKVVQSARRGTGQHRDYASVEAQNRKLGLEGELAVLTLIKKQLADAGRDDLADRTEHVSVTQGDGLGYDILTYDASDDEPLYVEVKTTERPKSWPFLVSAGEVRASAELGDRFRLYRVCDWGSERFSYYVLEGSLETSCNLVPTTYSVLPK